MTIKLTGLNLNELKQLRSKVDVAIQKLEIANISKARVEVQKLAKEYGVSLESLTADVPAKKPSKKRGRPARTKTVKARKKVAPKYRHPDDASLSWTGRGLKPKWVVALLENDVKLDDLQIK